MTKWLIRAKENNSIIDRENGLVWVHLNYILASALAKQDSPAHSELS